MKCWSSDLKIEEVNFLPNDICMWYRLGHFLLSIHSTPAEPFILSVYANDSCWPVFADLHTLCSWAGIANLIRIWDVNLWWGVYIIAGERESGLASRGFEPSDMSLYPLCLPSWCSGALSYVTFFQWESRNPS